MKPENYPLSRTNNLVTQETDDDLLIYDFHTDKAFCLNRIAALVWRSSNGTKSVKELAAIASETLKSSVSEDLIWIALDQLKTQKLLKNAREFQIDFNGLSRREVIKKVGMTSLIALPLVTSFIVPASVNAQSANICRSSPGDDQFNNGAGCPCNSSDDCCAVCGGAVDMMVCGGLPDLGSSAAAICFGIVCNVPPGQGAMNVVNQCPCNSSDDCCGVCGGAVDMMICGGTNC